MANVFDQFDDTANAGSPDASPYQNAVAGIESGGRYDAVGPVTGKGRALGKYQVMDFNVGPWSREALGREVTPQEFISSPDIQEAVFKHKFGQYAEKYGPQGAARAWFAGEGGMNNPNARDVLGTSVRDYEAKFNSGLGANAFAPLDVSAQRRNSQSAPAGNVFDQFDVPAGQSRGTKSKGNITIKPTGQPNVSAGEAIGRGLQQGVTFNFGDEMRGLIAAGGGKVGSDTEPAGPHNVLIGAYKLLISGDPEARRLYEETVAGEREANTAAEKERPYSYLGGNIAGAVALPLGGALNAATLSGRMARGAAVGVGTGAAYGAGEGTNAQDRATRAAVGAGIGGIVGGVAPPLVEGAIQGARMATAPVRRAIAGTFNRDGEAGRRVVTAVERDRAADPDATTRLTQQEFDDARAAGQPVMLADLGGGLTRRLADNAAITSPEGSTVLNRAINDRFEGQAPRITAWLRQTFHYPDADAQRQAIEQTARAVNRPAYRRAFEQNDGPMWDEALADIAQDPVMQSAIRRASAAVRTERTLDGYRPMNSPFTFEESSGRLMLRRDGNGQTIYPDLQFWDLVKRELDKQGTRESASFARTLRNHLDEITRDPQTGQSSYQRARQGAAGFFRAENALEAGENFVGAGSRFGLDEARRALAGMTDEQRRLFQDGYVSQFIRAMEKLPDRRNVLNQIGVSTAARAELNIALGRQRAAELETFLRVEGIVDLLRGAVQGNSWTARRLYEIGLAGGGGLTTVGGYNQDPQQMTVGVIVAALMGGGRYIDQRVARRVAEMLVSDDPAILQRGIQLVARNQRLLNGLRQTDLKIAATAGEQGGTE